MEYYKNETCETCYHRSGCDCRRYPLALYARPPQRLIVKDPKFGFLDACGEYLSSNKMEPDKIENPDYITFSMCATMMGVPEEWLKTQVKKKAIPYEKLGKKTYRFKLKEVRDFLDKAAIKRAPK